MSKTKAEILAPFKARAVSASAHDRWERAGVGPKPTAAKPSSDKVVEVKPQAQHFKAPAPAPKAAMPMAAMTRPGVSKFPKIQAALATPMKPLHPVQGDTTSLHGAKHGQYGTQATKRGKRGGVFVVAKTGARVYLTKK